MIEIVHSVDNDAQAIVTVTLTNSDRKAVLYQEDYNRLINQGIDPVWRLSQNRILARGKQRIPIARLILNAKPKERLHYIDRDCTNLKRNNLLALDGRRPFIHQYNLLKQTGELRHSEIIPSWEQDKELNLYD